MSSYLSKIELRRYNKEYLQLRLIKTYDDGSEKAVLLGGEEYITFEIPDGEVTTIKLSYLNLENHD